MGEVLKPKENQGFALLFTTPIRFLGIIGGINGGVFLIGSLDRQTADLYYTTGSALLSGYLFIKIGETDKSLSGIDIIYRFLIPGMAVGAVFGFNYTREYKKKHGGKHGHFRTIRFQLICHRLML